MIRKLFLTIIILNALLPVNLTSAESRDDSSDVLLVSEYNPPYIYKNEKGEFVGSAVKKLTPIFQKAGISFKMQTTPWKRALSMVEHQQNVLIYPLARTPERETKFKWLIPIHTIDFKVYGLRNKFDLKKTDITSGKYTFVCADKTILCTVLDSFGVPESSVIKIAHVDDKQMIEMVFRERVDFMIFSEHGLSHHIDKLKYDLTMLVPLDHYSYPVVEYLAGKVDFDSKITEKLLQAGKINLE